MSDSFKIPDAPDAGLFDCRRHFMALCESAKFDCGVTTYIDYPNGWTAIVEQLVVELKHYTVDIKSISSSCRQLDIVFEMRSNRNEVKVWRLINTYRLVSQQACFQCGNSMGTSPFVTIPKLCKKCEKEAGRKGSTGTWLDNY